MFRFDDRLTGAERAHLVELFGETAVRNHAVFLANFVRVDGLFDEPDLTEADQLELASYR